MGEYSDLLDAVDQLTKPTRTKIVQDDPATPTSTRLITVEQAPLLERLQEAIRGTIGIGGSKSLASERSMLDGDALRRFMVIATTVNDWARLAGADVHKGDPVATLRAWYVAYQQKPHADEADLWHARELYSWVGQINAKLDPPRVWDLPDPCPVCEAKVWFDPKEPSKKGRPRPLIVEYRETGPDLIQHARAMCRACEQVWGVRELAYALEEANQESEATS